MPILPYTRTTTTTATTFIYTTKKIKEAIPKSFFRVHMSTFKCQSLSMLFEILVHSNFGGKRKTLGSKNAPFETMPYYIDDTLKLSISPNKRVPFFFFFFVSTFKIESHVMGFF